MATGSAAAYSPGSQRRWMKRQLLFFLGLSVAGLAGSMAQAGLTANSTVFIILMENHNWSSILGSADAPYINNTLLPMASYCDQYYNPPAIHPSLPNYLWLEAGTGFGITNDSPPSVNHQSTTNHFVTQLKNAGISWKTYQENITGTTCPTTDSNLYFVKHNPFAYFDDVTISGCTSVMRPFTELASDLSANNLARYNFITPNICNDMHDSCAPVSNPVKQGDTWLAQNLPAILNSAAYQSNGLVIITWDEGASSSDGPIGMIVLSPYARGGGYHNAIHYTHSSTLRTLQKIFGTNPKLGGAAVGLDLSDLFQPGTIPNADTPTVSTLTRSATSATISWLSQIGVSYRVEWKNSLTDSAWQTVTPDFAGTGALISWTDDGAQTGGFALARFYRLAIP